MSDTDHLFNIKNIIIEKNQSETHLREYFCDNTINPSDYNDFKDLIIYAIDNEASNGIVTYLLDQRQEKGANFEIVENGKKKTPLLLAVINDNYKLADILIKEYKADINYIYKEEKYRITEILYDNNNNYNNNNLLTYKRLKYILEKGCITTYRFLYELIRNKDNKLYKLQYTCRKFKNEDIIKFLNLYKNCKEKKESLSNDDIHKLNDELKSLIKENKGRLLVNDELYEKSVDYHNYEALMITFENEDAEENVILNRIIKYDLFEKALDLGNYNYIKKILSYKPLHYMCKDYNEILSNLIKKYLTPNEIYKKENVAKLVIKTFINTSIPIYNKNNPSNFISDKGIPFRNLILNIAIENKSLDAVKYLCSCTSDEINTKDIKSKYPIFNSIEIGNYDIFKYLINKINNLNIKNNNGISLMNLIINENQEYMCEYLLKYYDGIAINENDSSGFTPLENAINKNNSNIVQMILYYGLKHRIDLNVNEKDSSGNLPLIKAINKNNFDMIFYILDYYNQKKIDVNIYDNNGNTPITLLYKNYINSGKSNPSMFNKIFDYLLEYYDINQTDHSGNTILYYAICNKDTDIMKKLLNMGANLLLKNNFKKSPMDMVFNQKNYNVFKTIIEYGNIDLNIENVEGDSFLKNIIKSHDSDFDTDKKKELIELLIKKGININFFDKNGNTPLVYAIQSNLKSIYNLLKENGAYINTNDGNASFLDELVQSEKYDYLEDICNSDSGFEMKELKFNSYSLLIKKGKNDLLKKIIRNTKNFNINMKNEENDNTLLDEAINNNNTVITKFLFDYCINKY